MYAAKVRIKLTILDATIELLGHYYIRWIGETDCSLREKKLIIGLKGGTNLPFVFQFLIFPQIFENHLPPPSFLQIYTPALYFGGHSLFMDFIEKQFNLFRL